MAHIEQVSVVIEQVGGYAELSRTEYEWSAKGPLAVVENMIITENYTEFRTEGTDLSGWKFGKQFELNGVGPLYLVHHLAQPPWTFVATRSRKELWTIGLLYRALDSLGTWARFTANNLVYWKR